MNENAHPVQIHETFPISPKQGLGWFQFQTHIPYELTWLNVCYVWSVLCQWNPLFFIIDCCICGVHLIQAICNHTIESIIVSLQVLPAVENRGICLYVQQYLHLPRLKLTSCCARNNIYMEPSCFIQQSLKGKVCISHMPSALPNYPQLLNRFNAPSTNCIKGLSNTYTVKWNVSRRLNVFSCKGHLSKQLNENQHQCESTLMRDFCLYVSLCHLQHDFIIENWKIGYPPVSPS